MFAIVIRFDELQIHFFKSIYLNGWEEVVGEAFHAEISYVQDALHGLSLYAHKPFAESEEALTFTESMSSGVLRTALSGTVVLPALHEIHSDLLADQDSQSCSQEAFAAIVNALEIGFVPNPDDDERFAKQQEHINGSQLSNS